MIKGFGKQHHTIFDTFLDIAVNFADSAMQLIFVALVYYRDLFKHQKAGLTQDNFKKISMLN